MTRRFWTTLAFLGVGGVVIGVAARTAKPVGDESGLGAMALGRELDVSMALDEQAFLEEMVSHHQAAVARATVALARTNHPEIRLLAGSVISRSEHEIAEMRSWHLEWFADTADAGIGGVGASPDTITTIDVEELRLTPDEDFETTFLSMMLTHYAGVLVKAEEVLMTGPREEVMLFAERISAEYAARIGQLQQWRDEWFSLR
jgi:uncharacterized protein (DUF305 family)